jgi:hypothetical protein
VRKITIILFVLLLSITALPLNIRYEETAEDVSMIINEEKIPNEVFKAQTDIINILSNIKNTNESFFQTLTNTATGLELLNTYNKQVALEFSGNILFIQFVEKNGINLDRESLRESLSIQFDQIIRDSGLTEEDLTVYLNSKGFSSKESYLDSQYYNALYERAIQLYYQKKASEYNISDEEIEKEYVENKESYIQPKQSEISIIIFENSEEASLTYKKISEGYYTFEEVFEEKSSEGNADNITINLNVEENEYINIVKNNAPGYISKPQKISENEFILIKILSKSPERNLSIDEAKNQIIFNLRDKKAKDYFDTILPEEFKKFKENSTIVFNEKLFY